MTSNGIRLFEMLFILLACFFANTASADVLTKNLGNEIASGNVSISDIAGTGGSSGTVLNGYLFNNTKKEINLDVFLKDAIHLINQGRGQNMYVLGVLEGPGRYIRSGNKSFIKLGPKNKIAVKLLSYCADFDKENPSQGDSFEIGLPSQDMEPLLKKIASYHNKYPRKDITKAAQVAIWIAQGESPSAIHDKFEYSNADLKLAYKLIGN